MAVNYWRLGICAMNGEVCKKIIAAITEKIPYKINCFFDKDCMVISFRRISLPSVISFTNIRPPIITHWSPYSQEKQYAAEALISYMQDFAINYWLANNIDFNQTECNKEKQSDLTISRGLLPKLNCWFLGILIGMEYIDFRNSKARQQLFNDCFSVMGLVDRVIVGDKGNQIINSDLDVNIAYQDKYGPGSIFVTGFSSFHEVDTYVKLLLKRYSPNLTSIKIEATIDVDKYELHRNNISESIGEWTVRIFGRLRNDIELFEITTDRADGLMRIPIFSWYETEDEFVDGEVVRSADGIQLELITNVSDPQKLIKELHKITGVEFRLISENE